MTLIDVEERESAGSSNTTTFDVEGRGATAFEVETTRKAGEVLRQGTLRKLGGKNKDRWDLVDVRLTDGGLTWSSGSTVKDRATGSQKILAPDQMVSCSIFSDIGVQHAFEIVSKAGKVYKFAATSDKECDAWILALSELIDGGVRSIDLGSDSDSGSEPESTNDSNDSNGSIGAGGNCCHCEVPLVEVALFIAIVLASLFLVIRGHFAAPFSPLSAALCLVVQAVYGKRKQRACAMVGVLIWLGLWVLGVLMAAVAEQGGFCDGEMVGEDCDIDCSCGVHGTQMDLEGARAACEPDRNCGEPLTCDGGTCACDDGYTYRSAGYGGSCV